MSLFTHPDDVIEAHQQAGRVCPMCDCTLGWDTHDTPAGIDTPDGIIHPGCMCATCGEAHSPRELRPDPVEPDDMVCSGCWFAWLTEQAAGGCDTCGGWGQLPGGVRCGCADHITLADLADRTRRQVELTDGRALNPLAVA